MSLAAGGWGQRRWADARPRRAHLEAGRSSERKAGGGSAWSFSGVPKLLLCGRGTLLCQAGRACGPSGGRSAGELVLADTRCNASSGVQGKHRLQSSPVEAVNTVRTAVLKGEHQWPLPRPGICGGQTPHWLGRQALQRSETGRGCASACAGALYHPL